jgi:taurine--2-oxoglutarate transaminase
VLKEDDLVGNSKRMGKVMASLMAGLQAKHLSVGECRNIGLFGAIELVKNSQTKEPMAPYAGTSPEMAKLGAFLKEHGVYAFTWRNLLHTNPPLCTTEAQLREVFEIIDASLAITDEAVTG